MPHARRLQARPRAQEGSMLAAALMIMALLAGLSIPLLKAASVENHRVNRQENYLAARLRAEGAAMEGVLAIKAWFEAAVANRTNVWDLVAETSPGLVIVPEQTSTNLGEGTTIYAYIDKTRRGGYEEFINYVVAQSTVNGETVTIRLPTWNMKLGDYSMWTHGTGEYDSADVNRDTRSASVTFTPGDYCMGHAYVGANCTIQSGAPRATFMKRFECAGTISGKSNGTFQMSGQPRENVTPYKLDYKAGFWTNAQSRAAASEGGLKLPGGYDYIVDLSAISSALQSGATTVTLKRRAHRADSSPSIEGDQATLSAATGKTSITALPIWSASTTWQDSDWMNYWASVTVSLPALANWNGVIFCGDVNSNGSVSQNSYLSTVLLKGTAQYKSVSVVATDDMFFIDNVYGGTSNGDFSRAPGNWSRGTGTPCTVAAIAKDEIEWSLVHPRVAETMCAMVSQYGHIASEGSDYSTQLMRMPPRGEWDYDYDFTIDPDSNLWNGALRESDGKNVREYGRGTRTVSLLSRSWTKDWYNEGPWSQRTGGPWIGAGGFDNKVWWHYPAYVAAGAYNTLSYDVDPSLSSPDSQPPIMPIVMNGFQLGGVVEPRPQALDTWTFAD